ncbi:hypothetical protein [Streptomyces gardneri]|uniref:hypothetical protein n=1 Tax=Streptomyces gardneri TaxID=66892 RepID=UPI0035D82F04
MTAEEPRTGLPIEFLRTIAVRAEPDSPPARMAVERARNLPESGARDDLILALLSGALGSSAPEWMLQAAIDSGLGKEEIHLYDGSPMSLVATALAHASCSDSQREEALGRCSVPQLGVLGREGCGETLAMAVVAELSRRGPHGQPMSPHLLEHPRAAQAILREPGLHDLVFLAALDLLPGFPEFPRPKDPEGDDVLERHKTFTAAREAWDTMWERIVSVQTGRHRQLITWAKDTRADHTIREHLLGTVPWDVEASLLEEVALDDLAGFDRWVLITRACRMLRDGLSKPQVRDHLSAELESATAADLRDLESFMDDALDLHDYGLHSAVSWVQSAAEGTWRHILNPSDAKSRYGEPHTWRAPDELLVALGRRFANVAVEALDLWEAEPKHTRPGPRDLRWLHAMLVHLPDLTTDVKAKARIVLQHTRPQPRKAWETGGFATDQRDRELADLRAAIEGILGDPAAAARNMALGDPEHVTVQRLAAVPDDVLDDYLARHPGDDELVEKTLLAFASRGSYRPKIHFADVLKRHSAPKAALLQITVDLRKRLGGGPQLREGWARQVLQLPNCSADIIRALPAWTALTVGGSQRGTAHAAVALLVTTALGDDEEAWTRFADSPASYAGPTAWLRLGDILAAAADGAAWPKPPAGR